MTKTIAEKIWDSHIVASLGNTEVLLYIDLHLLHEINTPQAFDGLREKGVNVHRPDRTLSTEDHNTPTSSVIDIDKDSSTWTQIKLLRENCQEYGLEHKKLGELGQGITHVIAPEQGRVLPGSTLVCCDSHTTTHGAFGALAFGIGTSQVEHVLATQTLRAIPFNTMRVNVTGAYNEGVDAKDLALFIINEIGTGGGQGCVIEYTGEAVSQLSMEQRMTLCNMTVEAGASAGIISPDQTTVSYLKEKLAERNVTISDADTTKWLTYATDMDAVFDKYVEIDAAKVPKMISWGTNPSQVIPVVGKVPYVDPLDCASKQIAATQALKYMGLKEGDDLSSHPITNVFIGSCTNGRIEDMRAVAAVLKEHKVHKDVHMLIVPGSMKVHEQVIKEGIDKVFLNAGADFRGLAGCSLCVGLNSDKLSAGKRTVSTSNRNFEGRQGVGVRTHITSPVVAAASAIKGHIASPQCLEN
ncbi:isopropylmalate isomerase large subunit [Moritella sp. PE36]|uniref:3-isopropylmalate dehydratase large subunit n=1 Tax=Moritella sp. PE36 TaxID=58051 RepID=UPI00015682EE|nr:3-isopropylmalate dehydratase large subunit [Moritella sp. PE36]EDM67225.1 isopropylmalate isomerase large subunit [Moritella sp. PE36]